MFALYLRLKRYGITKREFFYGLGSSILTNLCDRKEKKGKLWMEVHIQDYGVEINQGSERRRRIIRTRDWGLEGMRLRDRVLSYTRRLNPFLF